MTHITTDYLFEIASKIVTEELLREFYQTLQTLCNEEKDRIFIFRTLRYTRIRLYTLRKYLPPEEDEEHARFLEIAIGYLNTELELLNRYTKMQIEPPAELLHRWTGTFVEFAEWIYGLQETGCIDNGEATVADLSEFFGKNLGLTFKESYLYNAYTDMKRRKNESRTYFLDKMCERLNRRMERDDERELRKK